MPSYTTLIAGAYFRPPAKQLLAVLAAGHPLQLQEENDNPYDAEAVKVLIDLVDDSGMTLLSEAQLAALEVELPNAGVTLEQVMSTGPVHLGYVAASGGKPLAKARSAGEDLVGNHEVRELGLEGWTLGFALDGSPRLHLDRP